VELCFLSLLIFTLYVTLLASKYVEPNVEIYSNLLEGHFEYLFGFILYITVFRTLWAFVIITLNQIMLPGNIIF
jgi:peptidoglycan/LPS O-acetylase OafA/YrhL